MTKYRLQDTQRISGARTDPSLTELALGWRNKLEDFVRVIFKGDKMDLTDDVLFNPGINFKDPNLPISDGSANSSLVATLPTVAKKIYSNPQEIHSNPQEIHSNPQEIHSNPQEIHPKPRRDNPMNSQAPLNKVFKKKLVRNAASISLNRTYGSVDARQILNELDDLLQEFKFRGKAVRGRR